jgi:nitrogen regulatory protein PII
MQFKLIVALVPDVMVDPLLKAAREAGATGATVITNARGEGRQPHKTFFGLELTTQRDMLLLVVEESKSRRILETISQVAKLDEKPGSGIAIQIAIEDAVGLASQIKELSGKIED